MDEMEKEMKLCFVEEGRQLLEEAEQCFLELEDDRGSIPTLEKLFRIAHNIKGTSRAVGFAQVAEFTHEFENLLLELKEGRRKVTQPCIDIMLECNDAVKIMIDGLAKDLESKFDNSLLVAKLKAFMERADSGVEAGAPDSANTEEEAIQDFSTQERSAEGWVDIQTEANIAPAASTSDVKGSELAQPTTPVIAPLVAPVSSAEQKSAADKETKKSDSGPDESIRVSLKRLEKLSDYIGELVILQTVLDQHADEIQSNLVARTISQLGKLSKEIQEISLSLRMIPLKQTFAKLQRIVRDTGRALNKEIDLHLDGETTEVDKTVLENLGDPLVHIVRNAIDHGLETTADRLACGKPKAGRVVIRAFHKGNSLVIEVQDDGKGIDPEKLREKAVAKGLIRAEAKLSREECIQLLFKNGFSTKDQVSEISGRGVGLDVVKTNVEKMGGQVTLESIYGQGSTFKIVLPLTLAIVEGLICEVYQEKFVVPMANIKEIVRCQPDAIRNGSGGGAVINLRGRVLPLIELSRVLGMNVTELRTQVGQFAPQNNPLVILVTESRGTEFGVVIHEIVRQQQIVIKKLGRELANRKGFVGSAILGDGKPSLIIDLNDLVEANFKKPARAAA